MTNEELRRLQAIDAKLDDVKLSVSTLRQEVSILRSQVETGADPEEVRRTLDSIETDLADLSNSLGDGAGGAASSDVSATTDPSSGGAAASDQPHQVPADEPDLPGSDTPPAQQLPPDEDGGGTPISGGGAL